MFYDTVIFDAAGTLVGRESPDFFESFFVIAAKELGTAITIEEAKTALTKAMQEPRFRDSEGRMSSPNQTRKYFLDLYSWVLKEAGMKGDFFSELENFYNRFQDGRYLQLYSDVYPTLEKLKGSSIRLGILSNWSENLSLVLKRFKLDQYFSFSVVSAEVGLEKPNEKIFRIAISHANTSIGKILYVGDHPEEDILPAEKIGLDAILIDRYDKYVRYRLPSIRRLTDIPSLVGII